MIHGRQSKVDDQFRISYSFDNVNDQRANIEDASPKTASAIDLDSRINRVRNQLQFLKGQLRKERILLQEEQMKTYYGDVIKDKDVSSSGTLDYCYAPSVTRPCQTYPQFEATMEQLVDRNALSQPSKRHLEDIEKQCDLELIKLRNYIRNIGELKNHWKYLMMESQNDEMAQFHSVEGVNMKIQAFSEEQLCCKSDTYLF